MDEFEGLKRRLHAITTLKPRTSRYGLFLDSLVRVTDRRTTDARWDIWYISANTDFCRATARRKRVELAVIVETLDRNCSANRPRRRKVTSFDDLREKFAELLFFAFAALESFAHEVNIFYGLTADRRSISFDRLGRLVKEAPRSASIARHLATVVAMDHYATLRLYRNASTHGYVFPMGGSEKGLSVKAEPKEAPFSFAGLDFEILELAAQLDRIVEAAICSGWRCFEVDQLTS